MKALIWNVSLWTCEDQCELTEQGVPECVLNHPYPSPGEGLASSVIDSFASQISTAFLCSCPELSSPHGPEFARSGPCEN